MKSYEGQYSGAALSAFIHGLGRSKSLIDQILRAHDLDRIDENGWYSLDTARSIYYTVGKLIGDRSLYHIGLQLIKTSPFPPEICDVKSVLGTLDVAYKMNARGPNIGCVTCTFEDDHTAVMVSNCPFPCALHRGLIQGCCNKFGAEALIEHGAGGCLDKGDPSCTYHVTW